ncbi:MAG: efflux RND transporter periplasmic adaptor subunit, partial [Candidatus Muiribacteriaceae bacterium]
VKRMQTDMKIKLKKKSISNLEKVFEQYSSFSEKGFVSKDEFNDLKKRLETERIDLVLMERQLEEIEKGYSELEVENARIAYLRALKDFQKSSAEVADFASSTEVRKKRYLKNIEASREKVDYYSDLLEKAKVRASDSGVYMYHTTWSSTGWNKVTEGNEVSEGDNIGKVASVSEMKIDIELNESQIKGITPGLSASFSLDSEPDRFYRAYIDRVANLAQGAEEDANRIKTVNIKAAVEETGDIFRPGMTVSGRVFLEEKKNVICVPTSAINRGRVLKKGMKDQDVSISDSNYEYTVIENGVDEGDVILIPAGAKDRVTSDNREIIKAEMGDIRVKIEEVGLLEAVDREELLAPATGKVTKLSPEGQKVSRGDIVVAMDTKDKEKDLQKQDLELSSKQGELELLLTTEDKEMYEWEQSIRTAEYDFELKKMEYDKVSGPPTEREVFDQRVSNEMQRLRTEQLKQELEIKKELNEKGFVSDDEIRDISERYENDRIALAVSEIRLRQAEEGASFREKEKKRRDFEMAKLNLQMTKEKYENKKKEYELKKEKLRVQIRRIENNIDSLKKTIDDMSVKAPIDGVIVYVKRWTNSGFEKIKLGDELWTGMTMLRIARIDEFVLKGKVPETQYLALEKGQKAEFFIPSDPDTIFTAEVDVIGQFAENDTNSSVNDGKVFEVIMRTDSMAKRFQPGSSVNFAIITEDKHDVLRIPRSSLYVDDKGEFVYSISGQKMYINTGIKSFDWVEVISGIAEGDKILGDIISTEGDE